MTLELLLKEKPKWVRKFLLEDKPTFLNNVVDYLNQVDPEKEAEHTRETSGKIVRAFRKEITPEEFWEVVEDDQVTSEVSTNRMFLMREGDITLQGWMFELLADSEKEQETEAQADVVAQQLREKYPSLGRLRNENKYIMFVLSKLKRLSTKGKASEVVTEATTKTEKVLRNFKAEGKRLNLHMFLSGEIPSLRNLQIVGDTNPSKLKTYKRVLESEKDSKLRNRMAPLVSYLSNYIQGEMPYYDADKLDADKLIGKLDLKFLSRREEIYDYWQGIHENEFADLQTAVKDFTEGLEGFDSKNERLNDLIKKIQKYAKEFDQFPHSMQYTFQMKPFKMQDHVDKRDKYTILFERWMTISQNLGSGRYSQKKLIEELKDELGPLGIGSATFRLDEEGRPIREDNTSDDLGMDEEEVSDVLVADEGGIEGKGKYDTEISPPTEISEEARSNMQERSRLGRKLKNLMQDVEVDPLFYYVFAPQQNKENKYEAWLDTPLFLKEMRRLTRNFAIAGAKYTVDIGSELSNHIDRLMQQAATTRKEYHLPVSNKLIMMIEDRELWNELDEDSRKMLKDYSSNVENITDFLETVGRMIDSSENEMERLSSPVSATVSSEKDKDGKTIAPTMSSTHFGSSRTESFVDELGTLKDDFNKMLDAIFEYYVKPVNSRYRPFDEPIAFGDRGELGSAIDLFKTLAQDNRNANAFFMLLWAESIGQGGMILPAQLNRMTSALRELSKPSKFKDMSRLKTALRDLKKVTNQIMAVSGESFNDALDIEIGKWFHDFLQRNNKPDTEWNGVKVSELASRWEKSEIYPIEAIHLYLERSQSLYGDLKGTKTEAQKRSEARGGKKKQPPKAIIQFNDALNDMNIVKSDVIPVIEVHDTIRKMMGKPVYHNTSKLDNFNHMESAIDIMEKEYNVEVTASEIENIVKDVDSMESLSKRHGIPSESVYFLKATFR